MAHDIRRAADFIRERRKLLIPATYGVHSKIENDLRDYITQTFGHSTFAFYEAFLDRPAKWWESLENVKEAGTTEPFLSRFVYKSGLTPRVEPPSKILQKNLVDRVISPLRQMLKSSSINAEAKKNEIAKKTFSQKINFLHNNKVPDELLEPIKLELDQLRREFLQSPLIATREPQYHKDLEKLEFSLNDSFVLRGLLQLWLAVKAGGKLIKGMPSHVQFPKENEPTPIEGWNAGIFHGQPLAVKGPTGSISSVSIITRLSPENIQDFYIEAVLSNLDGKNDQKALDLLREYQIALRPWMDSPNKPIWVGVSISSDAIFWGQFVVLLPGGNGEDDENKIPDYEGVVKILVEHVQRTFVPILTIFETYLLERQWKQYCKNSKSKGHFPLTTLLGKNVERNKTALAALKMVGMGHRPDAALLKKELSAIVKAPQIGAIRSLQGNKNLFISLLSHCFNEANKKKGKRKGTKKTEDGKPDAPKDNWIEKLNDLERSLVGLWSARFYFIQQNNSGKPARIKEAIGTIEDSLVFEKYLISSPAILNAIMKAMAIRHGDRGEGGPSIKTALIVGGPGSGKDSLAKLVRIFSPGYRFGRLTTLNMASFRPKEAAVPLLLGLNVSFNQRGLIDALRPNRKSKPSSFSIHSLLARACARKKSSKLPLKEGKGVAFIFDELNSLDMDTQGALLRFLESGEILALGDFDNKTKNVDALIVGVMNEDPHAITKARTLDRVVRDKEVFGGILWRISL